MSTITTRQLVDVVDTVSKVRRYSSGTRRRLTTCQVERWGLRVDCPTPEDPFYESEVAWLLPGINIRLSRQHPRSSHALGGPTVLTAIRVDRDGHSWRTTDLLLGLSASTGSTARIVRSEEFAAAVAGRVIRADDADLALSTVHKTLEELSQCRHDLNAWLTHQRVFDVW